jgi:hypothetical protein
MADPFAATEKAPLNSRTLSGQAGLYDPNLDVHNFPTGIRQTNGAHLAVYKQLLDRRWKQRKDVGS